ncbi:MULTISPECIES: maleylacetoacetate isomerase [Thalassospira]|uniref:Maleylacetoacetate isomerase n=2 Tax=Thalassospira TaxID=168934 RepID=A0A367W3H0_9PROT|nr:MULTISPECIES: maleylacetoacetate isomerase [Thalassospira]MDG4720837.1 maleylacetoacetate isomerase [Thalassospira sp. FZY0004]RCK34965.1 maleylacetoacetate isomerase [Thalassospira profundimaris]
MSDVILYDYWRSSASYRVRIALGLVNIPYQTVPVDLLAGIHKVPDFLKRNPQGLVPTLEIDGIIMTQSVSIIEYLDETRPGQGLLPTDTLARQRVRALSHAIAMDIHPVCNLGVVRHVMDMASAHGDDPDTIRQNWMEKYIGTGLAAFEAMLAKDDNSGDFCHGNRPSMADICLIPQIYNARRWNVSIARFPRIRAIEQSCAAIDAFTNAHPDKCPR